MFTPVFGLVWEVLISVGALVADGSEEHTKQGCMLDKETTPGKRSMLNVRRALDGEVGSGSGLDAWLLAERKIPVKENTGWRRPGCEQSTTSQVMTTFTLSAITEPGWCFLWELRRREGHIAGGGK